MIELSVSQIKNNVVMNLVNTKRNQEMIANMPHREFMDLSIIYRCVVQVTEQEIIAFKITNGLLEKAGIKEEELFLHASENTKKMFPPIVRRLEDVIREIQEKRKEGNILDEVIREQMDRTPKESIWLIGNAKGINGAIAMLDEECLQMASDIIGSDLYILPSSIHEVLAVSTEAGSAKELEMIVKEVNISQVLPEERLSNNIYYYDRSLKKFKIATGI